MNNSSRQARWMMVGALGCALMLSTADAQAAGNAINEMYMVKGDRGTKIVAVSDAGVILIDPKSLKTYRAWSSKRKRIKGEDQDWFITRDVDRDGKVDLVSLGNPAFIISADGDPIYSVPKGCSKVVLGDFGANNTVDLMCRKGNSFIATTYDGQTLAEYKIAGLRLGVCRYGDVNGDLKDDVECEIKGKGQYLRVDINAGTEMGRSFEQPILTDDSEDPDNYGEQVSEYLEGRQTFDLNGDGTKDESLLMDGKAIVVRSKAKKVALGRYDTGPITAVLVDDIDGDNKLEIVLGGQGKVFVLDHEGKMAAELTADPKKLKRESDVEISGVNANNLEDSSRDAAKAVVEKGANKLASCYTSNVRRDPFTRVGRLIWNLSVTDKGAVKKAEKLHSDLNDKKVEGCVANALKKLKFSKAAGPGASVTVTLQMGFVDR
ncbi:MAG: AgmX/PglI C-terminal domain-containing protein [Myxococcota bacterium]